MSVRGVHWVHPTRSRIVGVAFCIVMMGGSVLAHVEEIPEASPSSLSRLSTPEEAGLQAASWVVTVPYGAAKIAYAIGGGIVGGLAWAVTGGNFEVGKSVWIPSMTGDYVVQPQHLTGQKPLRFVGVSSEKLSS